MKRELNKFNLKESEGSSEIRRNLAILTSNPKDIEKKARELIIIFLLQLI